MKSFKKAISLGLAAVLALSAAAVPAAAAEVKYPQPSATDPAAWYMYGDTDQNGKITSGDARAILRTACWLDAQPAADSLAYGAADYDRDGRITSRDARLVLRVAAKLESPAAQTAHPYTNKKSISAADAIARMQTLNELLKPVDMSKKSAFTYADRQVCDVKLLLSKGLETMILGSSEMKNELENMKKETIEENTFNNAPKTISPQINYNAYMQLKNNPRVVFGDIGENMVKSTAFSFDPATCTYKIRINFKDSSTTLKSTEDSPLRQVFSDIITVNELKSTAGITGGDSDIKMQLEATINKTTYYVEDKITNAYVEYTFNAVSNRPVAATYSFASSLCVPATLFKVGSSELTELSFVMITNRTLTMDYVF